VSNNDIKILLVAKHSKNKKFETLLKQVFPSEVPVETIDSIVVDFHDGKKATLDHSELEHPLPTVPNKTWSALIQAFSNVKKITIVININKVETIVGSEVSNLLDKHFK